MRRPIVTGTCPDCGTVTLDPTWVTILVDGANGRTRAAFRCPRCGLRPEPKRLTVDVAWRLHRAGAEVRLWRPPMPSRRPASAAPLTDDEVSTFAVAVRDLCVEDVLAECGGDR